MGSVIEQMIHVVNRIVLLGPPGCGKGSYAKHLVNVIRGQGHSAEHVSTGDMMRAEAARETALGREITACSRHGLLVPDTVVFGLLNPLFERQRSDDHVLIFDGFPRTVSQAVELQKKCPVDRVINITMREDVLIRKSCARRVCNNCGVSFNLEDVDEPNIQSSPDEESRLMPERFVMPPVLPTSIACIENKCVDRLVQREVGL